MKPNQAHAVDAPIACLFHFLHSGRRAVDVQRYGRLPFSSIGTPTGFYWRFYAKRHNDGESWESQ
jgi:hypothetical protein